MAEFGWAYVGDGNGVTDVPGPSGSVLLKWDQQRVTGSSALIFDTGSNVLEVYGDVSASANISASYFYGDGSNLTNLPHAEQDLDSVLTAGNTSVLSMSVNSITSSTANFTGLSAGTAANTSSYLALDANNNIILTSSVGGGAAVGVIGEAEDGDYTDGLYTDFTPTTPIGTAIDRFNEILKIISPPITPKVQSIDYDQSNGISAKLSFDDSYPITNYTASSTEGGFDAVARNAVYEADVSGSNFKLGIYNGQTFTGTVNYDVTLNEINSNVVYTADAFGQANNGTLKLELNGTVIHSVDLSSFLGSGDPGSGTADSLTSNSGFIDVSVSASTYDGNGAEWIQYQYRTAKYQIDSGDQNKGWNYLRVIHTIGTTDYASNYIEWINDPDGAAAALSISNERIEDITTNGSIYLSGVEYNTEITASYKAEINNIYRNVFPTGTPISFTTTNATTPSAQSVPDLGIGEDETKSLPITASFNLQGTLNPSQTIGLGINVTHPLKSNLSNAGAATATEFLIFDNTPPVSSNTVETFIDEDRRLISGSYDLQTDVTNVASAWDSTIHINTGPSTYTDGLVQIGTAEYSGRLYSPIDADLPYSGDFSSLINGSITNPDYSGETGTRTWFRKIQNTNAFAVYNMLISTTKSATLFNNSALGTGNLNVYIKIPGTTGWMDISQAFSYGNTSDGDGALISTAANDTDVGNNTHYITFGISNIAASDYVVIKFVGDVSWAGYIAQMSFSLPANQNQATPQVLSDINGAVTGIEANLSFGTSNNVPDYSNATGSVISSTDFNSNQLYNITDNRRGIFSSSIDLNGTINDAIGAGSGYPDYVFYNGYSGSLVLEVNGTEVHSVDLDNSLSLISSYNGNGSGFDLSAVSFSTLSGIPHYIKPYRTGTYQIDALDTNVGWNYARIIHRTSGDQTTNYIEWIVDPSGSVDDLSVTDSALTDFNHTDIYYQSGIGYFASPPTASYTCAANNSHRNVYSDDNDAVYMVRRDNLTVTNIRISGSGINTTSSAPVFNNGIPMGTLNNTAGCEEQSFEVTASLTYAGLSTSISGGLGLFTSDDILASSEIKHPFKNGGYARGSSLTKAGFMVYSGSIGSTTINTEEFFTSEDYRIVSGNYANQAAVTSSANTWDSTISINDTASYAEYADGLVTVNGYAISPFEIGNAGDTRNDSEGATGLQAPAGNPNYSALDITERTFYRYFKNTSGVLVFNPVRITLFGDATIIAANGTLGANNNIKVELKVPYDPSYTGGNDKSTGWCDVGSPYDDQQDLTVDGAGLYAGTLDPNVDSDGAQVNLNFQGKGIYNNQYFVVKITAHKDWTGYLSEIRMAYS
jgi:hypothetical protein